MRFFTLPPCEVFWPYILVNANNPSHGMKYLRRWGRGVETVILDSGVEIFRNPEVKDYPLGHIKHMLITYHQIRQLCPNSEVYLTCPDYPDDYNPGSLWLSEEVTNIERTAENIRMCVSKYPDVNWLIPLQGHYRKPRSVLKMINLIADILDEWDYVALANLCVERSWKVVRDTYNLARLMLPRHRIHVFGLDLDYAKRLRPYSFDSLAYTFPRGRGRASCKNKDERIAYFHAFIKRLNSG